VDRAFPRLHVVTDTRPGRDPLRVVRDAVAAAVRLDLAELLAVQVRVEDDATDRQAYELTLAVLSVCRPAGVLCLVNDRLHVAVGAGADGGHVGCDDLPVEAARRVLGGAGAAVLGATCRDPAGARAAVSAGADYLGVGPSFATTTKGGLPDPIGPTGVRAVAGAVPEVPVVAIGGVAVGCVPVLLAAGAYGVAVVGALSGAEDPGRVTTGLLHALRAACRGGSSASAAYPDGYGGGPGPGNDSPAVVAA
jgi:thiamine-phosphate pyrophosphorylase